ncbi:response regulator [Phormidium tenue FACHB-886]|nr:response regulator [Phormidium tenue FACHB-886]
MADSSRFVLPKFVLMVQPMSHQGAIWQAILRSQQLSVIWEASDVDLLYSLNRLKAAKVSLPDLLLIDTRIQRFNPYAACRRCRQYHPELKILLINGAQKEVTPAEREWAIVQGAVDLLPRIQRERLMSGAAERMKRVMEILEQPHHFNSKTLVAALLRLSRSEETPFSKGDKVSYYSERYSDYTEAESTSPV